MQSGANNFACMLVGRIVAGFAIGWVKQLSVVDSRTEKGLTQDPIYDGAFVQRELVQWA